MLRKKEVLMSWDQIQQLVQLPIYGLLVAAVVTLWRAYNTAQNARVDDLKQLYEKATVDLQSRIMMIEDRLGIKPPLTTATLDKPDVP